MAAFTELVLEQGTTFNDILTLTDDSTNALINVSGYIVTSQMRKSYYSANASATLVCTLSDAANGIVTISLDAANTANIPAGKYVFDVKTKSPSQIVSRLVEGIIYVTPQVTRG